MNLKDEDPRGWPTVRLQTAANNFYKSSIHQTPNKILYSFQLNETLDLLKQSHQWKKKRKWPSITMNSLGEVDPKADQLSKKYTISHPSLPDSAACPIPGNICQMNSWMGRPNVKAAVPLNCWSNRPAYGLKEFQATFLRNVEQYTVSVNHGPCFEGMIQISYLS